MINKTLTKRQKTIQAQRYIKHLISKKILPDIMSVIEIEINHCDHDSESLNSGDYSLVNSVLKSASFIDYVNKKPIL